MQAGLATGAIFAGFLLLYATEIMGGEDQSYLIEELRSDIHAVEGEVYDLRSTSIEEQADRDLLRGEIQDLSSEVDDLRMTIDLIQSQMER